MSQDKENFLICEHGNAKNTCLVCARKNRPEQLAAQTPDRDREGSEVASLDKRRIALQKKRITKGAEVLSKTISQAMGIDTEREITPEEDREEKFEKQIIEQINKYLKTLDINNFYQLIIKDDVRALEHDPEMLNFKPDTATAQFLKNQISDTGDKVGMSVIMNFDDSNSFHQKNIALGRTPASREYAEKIWSNIDKKLIYNLVDVFIKRKFAELTAEVIDETELNELEKIKTNLMDIMDSCKKQAAKIDFSPTGLIIIAKE